jgi:hypothetical protein
MPLVSGAPTPAVVSMASARTADFEIDRNYLPALLDAPDLWLWDGFVSGTTLSEAFSLSGVDTAAAGSAQLEVRLLGASESGNPVITISASPNVPRSARMSLAGMQPPPHAFRRPRVAPARGRERARADERRRHWRAVGQFLDRFSLTYCSGPC